ncbi:hypothetical protein BKA70DRAFT_1427910 [Coprinopsis sp. MPI-PUGE-AT-0042]|nr:hypothetical protein BKA70DRAFT_1427910 [Coprinopsis sp. MPI-PUGE-AT-0042]
MASEPLPPSDKEMNTYGGMFAASTFGIAILSSSLLVVQIVLVLYGALGFFATPKARRKGRRCFIIISSLMLVMCAIDIGFDLWKAFLLLYTGGPTGISYLDALGTLAESENWRWAPIGDAFFTAAIALGDFLMLWRCLVLWADKKWVVLFPFLACLGSIALNITYLVGEATSDGDLRTKSQLSSAVLNVTMNIMITFLIVLRVMQVRSRTAKVFPNQKPPLWYSEVTALVIESAAPLAIFGILFIALGAAFVSERSRMLEGGRVIQRGRHNVATDVVGCFYDAFCTLLPQMIIVRVTRGKAWDSRVIYPTEFEGACLSQPIQFARSEKEGTASNTSDSV